MEKITSIFKQPSTEDQKNENKGVQHSEQERVKAMGFKDAGMNKGKWEGLRHGLENLYNHYLSSDNVNSNENARMKRKNLIDKINAGKHNIAELNEQMNHILTERIPERQTEIEEIEKDINTIEQEMAEGKLDGGYSATKKYIFLALTIILGIALILFYTSLIYNAIFKNLASEALSVTAENIDDMMSAFLQVDPLFRPEIKVFVSYILAFVFIGMGCLHMLIHNKNKIARYITISGAYAIALIAEVLFAVKMERNIHKMDSMFNAQHISSHQSFWDTAIQLDVFLVIILGFVTYIIWGLIFNAMMEENQKRNQKISGKKMIELKKTGIRKVRKAIHLLKEEVQNIKQQIIKTEHELTALTDALNVVSFDRHDLLHLAGLYYEGWMKYIGMMQAKPVQEMDCQEAFRDFKRMVLGRNEKQVNVTETTK